MTAVGTRRPRREPTDRMRNFLGRHMYLTLATRDPDGSLHVVPVAYLFDDGRFLVATSSATRKARNLAARPDVTVTVDDRTTIEWVSAVGTADLVTGPESRALNRRLYRLWMTDEGLDVVGGLMHEVEDVTLVITPDRWLAWDWETGFVAELEAAGIPMDDPARWFRIRPGPATVPGADRPPSAVRPPAGRPRRPPPAPTLGAPTRAGSGREPG